MPDRPDTDAPDPDPRPETGAEPDREDSKEPDPTRGAGRKHGVQRPPEDQRGRPDPKEQD